MQQRSSIKMTQGRGNPGDFYELKDSQTPTPPQPRNFKIPSSTDLLGSQEVDSPPAPHPPRPLPPAPPKYAFQKFSSPPPSTSDDSLIANPRNIHCVVIADHIMDCPICSRFYRNYTPIYNVIILILGIALIILIIKYSTKNNFQTTAYIRPPSASPATL